MIGLIIVLIPAAGGLIGICFLFRHAMKRKTRAAGCAMCGYPVKGLTGFECPECGADLREKGITSKSSGAGPWYYAILFSLLLTIVALPVGLMFIAVAGPHKRTRNQSFMLIPKSRTFKSIRISQRGSAKTWFNRSNATTIPLQTTTFELTAPNGRTHKLNLDLRTKGFNYVDPDGMRVVQTSGFGTNSVIQWMKSAGLDTTSQTTVNEAGHIAGTIKNSTSQTRNALFNYVSSSSSSSSGQSYEGALVALVTSTLLWLLGVIAITRLVKRKKLETAAVE